MKKLTLLLFLAFATTFTLSAQNFGVKVLGNFSGVYGESEQLEGEDIESIKFKPGFGGGLFVELMPESMIGVRAELLYEYRQTYKEVEVQSPLFDLTAESDTRYQSINLPILASLNLGNLSVYLGPNFSYLLSAKGDVTTLGVTVEDIDYLGENDPGTDYSDEPFFNRFNIGGNIGVIYDITEALHVDLRVNHGITDFTNDEYDNSILTGESREDNDRWLSFQLGLGYAF